MLILTKLLGKVRIQKLHVIETTSRGSHGVVQERDFGHYRDVIMSEMASQYISFTLVYLTV